MFLLFLKTMASPPAQHCPTPHPSLLGQMCAVHESSFPLPGSSGYKCSFTARLPCGCCLYSQLPFQLHLRQVCKQGRDGSPRGPVLPWPPQPWQSHSRVPAHQMPKAEHISPWLPLTSSPQRQQEFSPKCSSPPHCRVQGPLQSQETPEELTGFFCSPWACGSQCDLLLISVLPELGPRPHPHVVSSLFLR